MNRVQPDNVHSTIFTPQEYQVELIDSCLQGNTVAVLASRSTRTFLVTMVTRELSYQTRSCEQGGCDQRTLIIGKSGPKLVKAGEAIQQNTNLAVATYTSLEQVKEWTEKWEKVLLDSQVIVMTCDVLEIGFETGYLQFDVLNLFVITDAHLMLASNILRKILSLLSPSCRILAMTSSVLNHALSPPSLDSLLSFLRKATTCKINTSSELVTILRYVNKPHERVIMCGSPFFAPRPDPESEVRRLTGDALNFLEDHRYDLVEVYGPEYAEFCVGVPDPIREPKLILKEFLEILDNLGLWCADRAALYSLVEIEKLKRKTAYDRHYLLLCMIFSTMARVRAVIESAFENHSELNQILNFSTPKVLRLIDILRNIRPLNFVDPRKRRDKTESADKGKSDVKEIKLCTKCNCYKGGENCDEVSISETDLPDATSEIVPTTKMEKGCENDEELLVCSSVLSEEVEQKSFDVNLKNIEDFRDEIPNGSADCDSFHSADEDLSNDDTTKLGCDEFTSTSYFNGTLNKSKSEDSVYESDTSCSIPLSFPTKSSSVPKYEGASPSHNEHSNAKSFQSISATGETLLEDSTESNLNITPTEMEKIDSNSCLCECHNVEKRTDILPVALMNGCEPLDEKDGSNATENISSNFLNTDNNDPDTLEVEDLKKHIEINSNSPDNEHDIDSFNLLNETNNANNLINYVEPAAKASGVENHTNINELSSNEILSDEDNSKSEISSVFDELSQNDDCIHTELSENNDCMNTNELSKNDACMHTSVLSDDNDSLHTSKLSENDNCIQNNELSENNDCMQTNQLSKDDDCMHANELSNNDDSHHTSELSENDDCIQNNELLENSDCMQTNQLSKDGDCIHNELSDTSELSENDDCLQNNKLSENNDSMHTDELSKNDACIHTNELSDNNDSLHTSELSENYDSVHNNELSENKDCIHTNVEELSFADTLSLDKELDESVCLTTKCDHKSNILPNNEGCVLQNTSALITEELEQENEKNLKESTVPVTEDNNQEIDESNVHTDGNSATEGIEDLPYISCGEDSDDEYSKENNQDVDSAIYLNDHRNNCLTDQSERSSDENKISELDDKSDFNDSDDGAESKDDDEKKSLNEPAKTGTSEAMAMADTLAQLLPNVTKPKRRREEVREKIKVHNPDDPDSVCGLIFVRHRTTAKIVYRLLKELSDIGGDFSWIFPQYTVELCKNASEDPRAAEAEHKKQEEVLRRFRHHECNLLVSTAVLEEGIDIPNCNLVLRFDPSSSYSSYVYSRGRATGIESFYFHLVVSEEKESVFNQMASYAAYEKVLLNECESVDLGTDSEVTSEEADLNSSPYTTSTGASVSMSSAIALLNRYCAKLPSDTFTRLTAMWTLRSRREDEERTEYQCIIMLPINSPLKGYTEGLWMPKKSLAKMSAALICCQRLHAIGELNDSLMPVGKESMQLDAHLCAPLPDDQVSEGMPRPGSTKRRQYYYKKVAECLVGNEPSPSVDLWVYKLDMFLTCPIPDEQNTRGRKIYRPELSARSLGLVTTKPIPQISGFPVFTRSGEVMVRLKEVGNKVQISEENLEGLKCFHMFTFTHVLRLEKYPIKFHPSNAKTTFFIAPLLGDNSEGIIDWDFVQLIEERKDDKPTPPSEEMRKQFKFKQALYQDAVVMPWYRNQDQPQYFYVAEICAHLHPQSDFPDAGFESFEKYYLTKYGIQIYNLGQPLLDVDHTSGRLNLLTPRHVNRKGVALPTTSEETKKAKRENLQQKQILVPELCTIHPFPASLWRKAVCLPTILYRMNGLLLANELRVQVASEIGLGLTILMPEFEWPNLDFGWTLADVLARSLEANKASKEAAEKSKKEKNSESNVGDSVKSEIKELKEFKDNEDKKSDDETKDHEDRKNSSELEIGTWSNDMALGSNIEDDRENEDDFEIESFDPNIELPDNLTMLDGSCVIDDDIEGELGADWGTGLTERKSRTKNRNDGGVVRVGSPSNFESDGGWDTFNGVPTFGPFGGPYDDYYDYCDDFDGYESEQEFEDEAKEQEEAEWEEQVKRRSNEDKEEQSDDDDDMSWPEESLECPKEKEEEYEEMKKTNKEELCNSKFYVAENEPIMIEKSFRKKQRNKTIDNGIQTEGNFIGNCEPTSSTEKCEEERSTNEISEETETVTHAEKATQTDDIAFATNTEPEICYNVDREKTLSEVKIASENLPPAFKENEDVPLFSFDKQPDLEIHPGPSPSIILQALTMSNANDGVNLERLETIGDSYLKYAITNYLYCTHTQKHEGKLSYLRSKQVSNLNLYRLGKRKGLGECMVATKFEPHDNWLPPGYFVPKELEEALIDSGVPAGHWNMADFPGLHDLGSEEIRRLVQERSEQIKANKAEQLANELISVSNPQDLPIFIPYNLLTQHSIPDKSISDCVEALIGAYLTTCGPRGALLFMSWLGIKVLPSTLNTTNEEPIMIYHQLQPPSSPLDACPLPDAKEQLDLLLSGYNEFEKKIGYVFRDRSYLLQAFTHASYYRNRLTDCYQRLEFLGDAVLDYLITRHLFEDKRQHSPGSLTDLRSALVNNTIFACLAVKFEFHKYFRHFSPGLDRVVRDFVRMQEENGHKINEEYYFMEEEECEAAEDIEVPKALGDVFESVAGAVFLDSGGSLDAVWRVYYSMMKNEIEQFSGVVPKSPIRELLETEPETAKFGKPERLVDGKVRVSVEIFGKGCFSGVGRNYRIAKSTAAKRALRHLKKLHAKAHPDNPIFS